MTLSARIKRRFFATCLFAALPLVIGADIQTQLDRADELHESREHVTSFDLLAATLADVSSDAQRAEVYWRMAREQMDIGGEAKRNGASDAQLLTIYEQGEAFADRAITADPYQALGYYWKSVHLGRWGQIRGALNALFKLEGMRSLLEQTVNLDPDHAPSYFVLGQLFTRVPGFPLSFGNVDYGVSFGRRALEQRLEVAAAGTADGMDWDYYVALAAALHDRNWSATKRAREQARKQERYGRSSSTYERGRYYEAMVELSEQSDREEAVALLELVVSELTANAGGCPECRRD